MKQSSKSPAGETVSVKQRQRPPQSEPDSFAFLESWHHKWLDAAYGKTTPHDVAEVIQAMKKLKKAEIGFDHLEQRLNQARIAEALGKWSHRSLPKHSKSVSVTELWPIAQKYPDVDREVFQWFQTLVELQRLHDVTFDKVGRTVCGAHYSGNLSFFERLYKTQKLHADTYNRSRHLKERLLYMVQRVGSFHLPFTLSRLTERLRFLHDWGELDVAYVGRLCGELGIILETGKPGRRRKHRKL